MIKPFFLALVPLAIFAADTAMFRGGPAHSGVYVSAAPDLSAVKWKFKTGAEVISSPAVAGGSVYFGSADHNLYAVRVADGSLRWKFGTNGQVTSSPGVDGGTVYAGSLDGNFYAVDAENGKLRWKFKTGGERRFTAPGIHGAMPRTEMMADPFDVFLSSPAIAEGVIYFGSGDNHLYALDARSGELKWKFATGNVVHASPAIANGMVYIGSWDRYLYALDAKTGAVNWKFETGDDQEIHNQVGIVSSAAVVDGTVYFGCRDGHFYAVDAALGTQKWIVDNTKGWVIASPAVRNGKVYFPTSDGMRFKAIDALSGRPVFDFGNKAISFSSPAIVNDTAYFGSSDGWLHSVDLKAGKINADFQTDGSRQNAALYTDAQGRIAGSIYPDATLDGMIIGVHTMFKLGSVISSPVVADGVLYVGSTDGQVYAIL